jgi:hypothetical protein
LIHLTHFSFLLFRLVLIKNVIDDDASTPLRDQTKDDLLTVIAENVLTLQEAATFCLCRSQAWAKKDSGTGCWWVRGSQIKIESLEIQQKEYYLNTYGSKQDLAYTKLEMGATLLFDLGDDEPSKKRHLGERVI